MTTMSNGTTGGIFANLTDLQASKPRVDTVVGLATGERYSVKLTDTGANIAFSNSNFAEPIGIVTPIHFGAVGDGVNIDDIAMQKFFDFSIGQDCNGLGKTYKINSALTCQRDIKLKNIKLDFTGAPMATKALTINGSVLVNVTPSSITKGDQAITVPDGSAFSVGDKVNISSSDIFSTAESSTVSEWATIRDISGNVITLTAKVLYSYTTNPTVTKYSLLKVGIDDLELISTENLEHQGLTISMCDSPIIRQLKTFGFGERGSQIDTSYAPIYDTAEFITARTASGLAYGVSVGPKVDYGKFINGHGEDLRHCVTIGALDGTCNHNVISGWTSKGCTDSALDSHPNSNYTTINNNVLGHETSISGGSGDGITAQGGNTAIVDNIIYGCSRASILSQPLSDLDSEVISISGNSVFSSSRTGGAVIAIDNQKPAGSIKSINIEGLQIANTATTSGGIFIESQSSGVNIGNIVIGGMNIDCTGESVYILARSGRIIKNISLNGGIMTTSGAVENIYFNAVDSNGIVDVVVNGIISDGGTNALRQINVTNAIYGAGTRIKGWSTSAVSGAWSTTAILTT